MNRLFKLAAALVLAASVLTPAALAQRPSTGSNDPGFNYARDFSRWTFRSSASVSTGAQSVTIQGDAYAVTPGGYAFYPLATDAPLRIDAETPAVTETVTPSAVTCTSGSLQSTCTFTATFANAHSGNFTVTSGTFGIQEAINELPSAGGVVVVSNGFGGSTATITTTTTGGEADVNILDVRNGAYTFYALRGSLYVSLFSPAASTNGVTAVGGRLNTAQGATIASGGASCVAGDCTLGADGNFFIISGTTAVDGFATAGWTAGSKLTIRTSGAITFNNAGTVAAGFGSLLLVGALNVAMTADDLMELVYDGTSWNQVAPTLVK